MFKIATIHNLLRSQISIWLKLFMEGGFSFENKKKDRPSKMLKMAKNGGCKIISKEIKIIVSILFR
ncbi:MAG: hypothetical protein E6337_08730 [Ligilactobacillus salivarius]|nr:hypothetical protein [Ligilactobacillus salivarius]